MLPEVLESVELSKFEGVLMAVCSSKNALLNCSLFVHY